MIKCHNILYCFYLVMKLCKVQIKDGLSLKKNSMEFTLKTKINTTAKEIYTSWLNSIAHTKMTGGTALASNNIGDNFSAWDGYIKGRNLDLEPYKRILQSWRTLQFEEHEEDSQIEIMLNEVDEKTELILIHTNVPESGGHYKKGWDNHYFQPMKEYFSK